MTKGESGMTKGESAMTKGESAMTKPKCWIEKWASGMTTAYQHFSSP
jgi:hypothetical protein